MSPTQHRDSSHTTNSGTQRRRHAAATTKTRDTGYRKNDSRSGVTAARTLALLTAATCLHRARRERSAVERRWRLATAEPMRQPARRSAICTSTRRRSARRNRSSASGWMPRTSVISIHCRLRRRHRINRSHSNSPRHQRRRRDQTSTIISNSCSSSSNSNNRWWAWWQSTIGRHTAQTSPNVDTLSATRSDAARIQRWITYPTVAYTWRMFNESSYNEGSVCMDEIPTCSRPLSNHQWTCRISVKVSYNGSGRRPQ